MSRSEVSPANQAEQDGENSPRRYEFTIHTFGCKVNTYDTGLLQKRFEVRGSMPVPGLQKTAESGGRPRVHVLNTCAVTREATKEAVKLIRRIKAHDPLALVVVSGCGAQVDGDTFDSLSAADLVVANSHKGQLELILDRHFKGRLEGRVFRSNIFRKDDLEAGGGLESGHTRAFLKIQDGCNSFCTYCVIPFARGKSRAVPVRDLVERVQALHDQGVAEAVLTGVHIGDYRDGEMVLHDLVAEILAKTKMPRIRLSSLEPVELSPELVSLFSDERLCRHFHMSIQSANTRVLRDMRRQYRAEDVESALFAIQERLPDAFVGMDVIAGFPGETEEEFSDTFRRLSRLPWTRLHVFPYSERPGTKAANFANPVPAGIRSARSRRVRELSCLRLQNEGEKQIGREKKCLVLKGPGRGAEALARDYWPVRITNGTGRPIEFESQIGREIRVQITGAIPSGLDMILEGRQLGEA